MPAGCLGQEGIGIALIGVHDFAPCPEDFAATTGAPLLCRHTMSPKATNAIDVAARCLVYKLYEAARSQPDARQAVREGACAEGIEVTMYDRFSVWE